MSIADDLRRKQNIRAQKVRKRNIILGAATAVIVFAAVIVCTILSDVSGVDIKESITVRIEQGTSAKAAVNQLKKAGAVKHPLLLRMKAMGSPIQPGSITVEPGMSYKQIAAQLHSSKRGGIKVVIPEGFEVRQIVDRFVECGIDRDEMEAAVNSRDYAFDFVKEIPDRENLLEGYLFPDTYSITENTTAKEAVNMMLARFNEVYDNACRAQAEGLGYTMDQIVTLASIIERETGDPEERGRVAGVFYNRLEKNIRLQSCATVQYILKERKTNLSVEDTRIESPYNTYMNFGLPIGPISCPGKDCLIAALYPETTTALYFVVGKDGKHVFSETYEEHLAAKEAAGV